MSQLARDDFEAAFQQPPVSDSADFQAHSWTLKSRWAFLQETVLILGMQLLFRASLMLRRCNY